MEWNLLTEKKSCFVNLMPLSTYAGYNHPALLSAFDSKSAMRALVNRPALGVYPGADWVDTLQRTLLSAAPPGLDQVS